MKTLIMIMTTVTLINAGTLLHDGFLFILGLISAVLLWKQRKSLNIKTVDNRYNKEV